MPEVTPEELQKLLAAHKVRSTVPTSPSAPAVPPTTQPSAGANPLEDPRLPLLFPGMKPARPSIHVEERPDPARPGYTKPWTVSRDPNTLQEKAAVSAGEEKLTSAEKTERNNTIAAIKQVQSIPDLIGQLPDKNFSTIYKEYLKYAHPVGAGFIGAEPRSPAYADLFAATGQLQALMQGAYSKGRMPVQIFNRFDQHLPHPGEPTWAVVSKNLALINDKSGVLAQMLKSVIGSEAAATYLQTEKAPKGGPTATPTPRALDIYNSIPGLK